MNRLHSAINWISITSEISHFFCCGIPIIFSILSLISGMGIIVSMPMGISHLHEAMHDYEVPMIIMSGSIILLGWTLHIVAKRIDCHSTGCGHEPCAPKKKRSSKILIIATGLFALNLAGYFLLHT